MSALSVLSVEPYGMKLFCPYCGADFVSSFSALGRAVWDETVDIKNNVICSISFSALGRAVWDETKRSWSEMPAYLTFSALGRAVWDETAWRHAATQADRLLSVLSVEPYGMKPLLW